MKTRLCAAPNICGEVINETALNDFLQEHEESPFSEGDLTEWLKERKSESEIIKTVLRQLKDYGAQVEVNIDAILMDLEIGNLVSYTFTSLNMSDMILPKQKIYLSSSPKEEKVEISPDIKQKSWLTAEIKKTMRRNLEIFKNLINSKDFCQSTEEVKGQSVVLKVVPHHVLYVELDYWFKPKQDISLDI
ncbi:hypothetical protein QQF64_026253 [Cirrhinus molitorella]|uniref:Uncharacterized protein n=1 Tax=Cirrhinus molitorella TaxID=172907 RepID=A0ABR3NSQ0_9TELE